MEFQTPVVARVLRGGRVESVHRGIAAIVDADRGIAGAVGDPRTPVYIRSAGKPFQALPLLEAGGERLFGLSNDEVALLCASHGGEPRHVRVARRMLRRGGFTVEDLACGAHWPMHEGSARALVRAGRRPTPLHNNCSGKHAGLLLACRAFGFSPKGYVEPDHPIQKEILRRVSEICGVPATRIPIAVDGCSLPVFELPLSALALGYARLVVAPSAGERPERVRARRTIVRAMTKSPGMVAGAGRFTTDLIEAGRGRWIGKEGAEGVYAMGLRPTSTGGPALGIALKIEDGSSRPRDAVTLAILERACPMPEAASRTLEPYRNPVIRNVRGAAVGRIEARFTVEGGR